MLSSRFPEFDEDIQVTEHMWAELMPSLMQVTASVTRNRSPVVNQTRTIASADPHAVMIQDAKLMSNVYVQVAEGERISIYCKSSVLVSELKLEIEGHTGIPSDEQVLWLNSVALIDERRLSTYNIRDGSIVEIRKKTIAKVDPDMLTDLFVKKPVIYLLPPVNMPDVRVRLSLVDTWQFSTLYPPAQIDCKPRSTLPSNIGQSVEWTVDAKPDGTLFGRASGREVSYLFWEGSIIPAPPLSPTPSRPSSPDSRFDPLKPMITPSNRVVLSFTDVTAYIDDALMSLGLHTEARCSFITYWLPDLQRHSYIALRFLPQTEYEAAAPMHVSPAPDVTTRVFMLFRGVEEDELAAWTEAQVKANESAEMWRDVVGVDIEGARDAKLFRVLEWGGMEAK